MKSSLKKAVTALLAAALLAAAPCTPVFGAQTYYVNDGSFAASPDAPTAYASAIVSVLLPSLT